MWFIERLTTESSLARWLLTLDFYKTGVYSILGPFLLLIYIKDTVQRINSSLRLSADDPSLYVVVKTPIMSFTLIYLILTAIYE